VRWNDLGVRHARFDVAYLSIDQVNLPLKAGYLLVADTDDAVDPQWELLAYALDEVPLALGTYRIDLTTLDGRVMGGDAFLVRSVAGVHVLRGAEALDGVDPTDLR
jgi:hypothetical protein